MGRSLAEADSAGREWALRLLLLVIALVAGIAAGVALDRVLAGSGPGPAPRPVTSGVPGPGPRSTEQGIAIGYAHTKVGAAQATGNYVAALGGPLALDPSRARLAMDAIAEPSARARLETGLSASLQDEEALWGIQSAARNGQRVMLTQTPIAYHVDTYTPAEATVRIWLVTSVGVEGRQRLAAFYAVTTAVVAWSDGDWRLRSFDAGSQAADVVPVSLQTPTPTGGVPVQLDGFVAYGG
jgi:hypothetical protein